MIIEKVIIENYKSFEEHFELKFSSDVSIVVGDNEVGKTSLLEAINLALTNQINGRNSVYELTPYLFNTKAIKKYIQSLKSGKKIQLPKIIIELYLKSTEEVQPLRGTNNLKKEDCPGIHLSIEFNESYAKEYEKYIENPDDINTIPIEYYEVKWYSFAYDSITNRSIPINATYIDTSSIKLINGTDKYISKIINDILEDREKAQLSLSYRKLKETFASEASILGINQKLNTVKGNITNKELAVAVDVSTKSNWESALTSYLDEVPFSYAGQGEQSSIKMRLALETQAQDSSVVLIEEPENHLSFSNMNKLIEGISSKCNGKQLILTTHSTYVVNKLGLENLILFNKNKKTMYLSELKEDTQKYFKKLPGYDTLRMLLSENPILCEGPSDELIIQKAYLNEYGKLPIEDGIDVITVKGLSFKRFLEIANLLEKPIKVVTDNDGDIDAIKDKYKEYDRNTNIQIFYDLDIKYKTLEPQIVKVNRLEILNKVLEIKKTTEEDMIDYMIKNKAECALKIFESKEKIYMPEYIKNAIKK